VTRFFIAPFMVALFSFSPALAEDCKFSDGAAVLQFASPTEVSVDGELDYTCDTSSAGTGVSGRMAHCSDGFEGPMVYNDDQSITFRDTIWKPTCDDTDVLGLMGN